MFQQNMLIVVGLLVLYGCLDTGAYMGQDVMLNRPYTREDMIRGLQGITVVDVGDPSNRAPYRTFTPPGYYRPGLNNDYYGPYSPGQQMGSVADGRYYTRCAQIRAGLQTQPSTKLMGYVVVPVVKTTRLSATQQICTRFPGSCAGIQNTLPITPINYPQTQSNYLAAPEANNREILQNYPRPPKYYQPQQILSAASVMNNREILQNSPTILQNYLRMQRRQQTLFSSPQMIYPTGIPNYQPTSAPYNGVRNQLLKSYLREPLMPITPNGLWPNRPEYSQFPQQSQNYRPYENMNEYERYRSLRKDSYWCKTKYPPSVPSSDPNNFNPIGNLPSDQDAIMQSAGNIRQEINMADYRPNLNQVRNTPPCSVVRTRGYTGSPPIVPNNNFNPSGNNKNAFDANYDNKLPSNQDAIIKNAGNINQDINIANNNQRNNMQDSKDQSLQSDNVVKSSDQVQPNDVDVKTSDSASKSVDTSNSDAGNTGLGNDNSKDNVHMEPLFPMQAVDDSPKIQQAAQGMDNVQNQVVGAQDMAKDNNQNNNQNEDASKSSNLDSSNDELRYNTFGGQQSPQASYGNGMNQFQAAETDKNKRMNLQQAAVGAGNVQNQVVNYDDADSPGSNDQINNQNDVAINQGDSTTKNQDDNGSSEIANRIHDVRTSINFGDNVGNRYEPVYMQQFGNSGGGSETPGGAGNMMNQSYNKRPFKK